MAGEYVDNDVSAYSGRVRPEYERLLRDISDGLIDALIVWHQDRLHRRPVELEHFLTVTDRACIAGQVRTMTGNSNFGTGDRILLRWSITSPSDRRSLALQGSIPPVQRHMTALSGPRSVRVLPLRGCARVPETGPPSTPPCAAPPADPTPSPAPLERPTIRQPGRRSLTHSDRSVPREPHRRWALPVLQLSRGSADRRQHAAHLSDRLMHHVVRGRACQPEATRLEPLCHFIAMQPQRGRSVRGD